MTMLTAKSRISLQQTRAGLLTAAACLGLSLAPPAARAEEDAITQEDLRVMMQELQLQKKKLSAQEQALAEQQRVIANQQNQLNFLKAQVGVPDDPALVPVAYNLGNAVPKGTVSGVLQAQDEAPQGKEPVGEAPEQERPQVAIIQDQGGVLTRRGQLIIEPSIQYTHSDQDRFFFQGFEFSDTVLIGLIEATRADRNTIQAALGGRIGVTDRLEFEARVPYIYRNDKVQSTVVSVANSPTLNSDADGNGIGDVEAAVHYDFTDLIFEAPYKVYTVANLKVKAPTGEGPFDVDLDPQGNPTELATGSGFWAVQPSLTAIFPNDPVVFFGTVGYTVNIGEHIGKQRQIVRDCPVPPDPDVPCQPVETNVDIGTVDPGDSVNTSIGMGLSLNERTSVSLGFSFDYVFTTTQETVVDDENTPQDPDFAGKSESDPLYIGSFTAGWSYQVSDNVGINLNFQVGATEAAPDFQTTLRVPIRLQVF
jgi:hypothetical protein